MGLGKDILLDAYVEGRLKWINPKKTVRLKMRGSYERLDPSGCVKVSES